MRSKFAIYTTIFISMVIVLSVFVENSMGTISQNQTELNKNYTLQNNFDHLLINFQSSLHELYRYQTGQETKIESLLTSIEFTDKYIGKIKSDNLQSPELTRLIHQIESHINIYKHLASNIITYTNQKVKSDKLLNAHMEAEKIHSLIQKSENLSKIQIDKHIAENNKKLNFSITLIRIIIFASIAGIILILLHLNFTIIRPMKQFLRTVENISESKVLSIRAEVPRDSDIALLAHQFNGLMNSLEEREKELKQNYQHMEVSNLELKKALDHLEKLTSDLEEKSEELEEANIELMSLDKLKDDFMHNISHELRTPLTPIVGYLELINNNMAGDFSSEELEMFSDMNECAMQLSFVIDSLLEIISMSDLRQPTERKDYFELKPLFENLHKSIQNEIQSKNIKFTLHYNDIPSQIFGTERKIYLMLTHIIKNSIKFTNKNGAIDFTVKPLDEKNVQFIIQDTGIGIPENKIKQIFEPFVQVDSSRSRYFDGIGLGLTLVKKIVSIHNGTIDISSTVGKGTTVTLTIPSENS